MQKVEGSSPFSRFSENALGAARPPPQTPARESGAGSPSSMTLSSAWVDGPVLANA
jgi:hypothetical protein